MRKLWLLLGGLLAGLIVAELLCRQFMDDPLEQAGKDRSNWRVAGVVADPELGFSLQPGFEGRMAVAGEYDVPFRISSQALRDDRVYAPEHPGVTRLLLVGDSFVFGVGVELGDTLGRQLERALDEGAGAGQRFEVVAVGCPSYGLDAYALLVERWVPRLRPDLVIVALFPGNDLIDYELQARDRPVVMEGRLVSPRQAWSFNLRKHSVLAHLLLQRFNPHERVEDKRPAKPRAEDIVRIYRSLEPWLERLAAAPGPDGPHLATLVLYGQDNVASFRSAPKGYTIPPLRETLSALRKHGVLVLDPKDAWREDTEPLDRYFFPRDAHYTALGHRFVAEWLAARLRERFEPRFGAVR